MPQPPTSVRLAVDLGTTHTVAVVCRGDQRPRALLFDGSPLLPSGVFLDGDGVLHTGRDAQRLAATEPDRFEPHPKRRIDDGGVLLGGDEVPVEELLTAVLRRVAEESSGSGLRPAHVTLTHPADWGPVRRGVLERAASAAGLGPIRLLPEPVGAAAYCTRELDGDIPRGACIAIFDFGGGTLDVAVVRPGAPGEAETRTLAVGGLDDLGGLDIDQTLVAHLGRILASRDPELWRRLDRPDDAADRRDRLSFWSEVRAAKEMLSRASSAPVAVPGRDSTDLHLTRDELTSLADPLIARAVDETRRTIERAGVAPTDLAMLLLVGGTSRMPQVATRLHSRLGVAPFVPEQPELPVAYGALLHGIAEAEQAVDSPPRTSPASVSPQPDPLTPVQYMPYPAPGPGATPPAGARVPDPTPAFPLPQTGPPAIRQPQRRGRAAGFVAAALILVLAVALGYAMQRYDWSLTDDLAGLGEGVGSESDGDGAAMPRLYERELVGGGAAAVAVTDELVLVAETVGGQTEITALTGSEGEQLWAGTFEVEPTELRMTVVGGLLVVDAASSATDDGRDMRVVVSLEDGGLQWKEPWEGTRREIAYYGTEVVVEINDGIYDNAVVGIDLETGDEMWAESGPDGLWIGDEERVQPSTHWDDGGEAAGALPPDSGALYDNLVVDSRIVEVDPDTGTGYLREASNGEIAASGSLPLDAELWTVYEDLAIGRLSDDESPGRDVLAAYSLPGFERVWELPLDAGDGIESVKPCGATLVCAQIGHSGSGDLSRMIAVDIADGDQAWSLPVDWSMDADWFTAPGGMVFGEKPFPSVPSVWNARLLGFDGEPISESSQYSEAKAVRSGLAAVHVTGDRDGRMVYDAVVWEISSGTRTIAQEVGADPPESMKLHGDLLAVLTSERTVAVFDVSALR